MSVLGRVLRLIWRVGIFPLVVLIESQQKERKVSYGQENADKTFYVIGYGKSARDAGLFWLVLVYFAHIVEAVERGYIPVVDLQNYDNQYLAKNKLHKENAWEYYFEQPMGYTLRDIRKSKNVVLSRKDSYPEKYLHNLDNKEVLAYLRKLYGKYVRFNKSTLNYLKGEYKRILKGKKKVLGVLCRGTDYTIKKTANHFIQPSPQEMIKKAKDIMLRKKCTHIYLATEDQNNYDLFKRHFGRKLLTNEQIRFSQQDMSGARYLSRINFKEGSKQLIGLQYLSTLNLLSKCACFISGVTAGRNGVHLMSSKFEYTYTYWLGHYPDLSVRARLKRFLKIS